MARHYFKCWDCLEPFAINSVDHKFSATTKNSGVRCPFCGGNTYYMGMVQGVRLVTKETRCACDDRCTNAVGHVCDCQCGGENHGTHRVVEVTVDRGGIPQPMHLFREECVDRAVDFLMGINKATAHFESKHAPVLAEVRANRWVKDYKAWRSMFDEQKALNNILGAKTHKNRMKKIHEFLGEGK